LVDFEKEMERLTKEKKNLEKELARANGISCPTRILLKRHLLLSFKRNGISWKNTRQ
jgi:hypothetical protein